MLVTSIFSIYEICSLSLPGDPEIDNTQTEVPRSQSCSTAYETITMSHCSTVLTGFFTTVTVTDCEQNITFSTQTSYSFATSTRSSIPTAAQFTEAALVRRDTELEEESEFSNIRAITKYYIVPWTAFESGNSSFIRIRVCEKPDSNLDFTQTQENEFCSEHHERWEEELQYIPVTTTRELVIEEALKSVCTHNMILPSPSPPSRQGPYNPSPLFFSFDVPRPSFVNI